MTATQTQGHGPAARLRADTVRDILIVDDHPLMCDALALTLRISLGLTQVRCARSLADAVDQIRDDGAPDAVILDLNLPDARGAEGLVALRRTLPDVPITMMSADLEQAMIAAVMAAGAQGCVCKSLGREALIDSLRRMWDGEHVIPQGYTANKPRGADAARAELARRFATLTPRQMAILRHVCAGRDDSGIGAALGVAQGVIRHEIAAILRKINARRRAQAVLLANSLGLFAPG